MIAFLIGMGVGVFTGTGWALFIASNGKAKAVQNGILSVLDSGKVAMVEAIEDAGDDEDE